MEKALSGVDKKLYGVERSLKDVNKLLKLDPTNTELLNQKQKLLQQSISETKNRLETLKQASEQAAKTAGNYDAWKEAYTPIQEEIVKTNEKMDKLKKSMKSMEESGQIDTEEYKKLQTEVDQSSDKLKELKAQKKQVDDEFGQPISPEGFDSLQREIIETEQKLKSLKETTGSASANLAKVSAVSGEFGNKVKGVGQSLLPVTGALTGVAAASTVMANNFNDAMSQAAGALDKPMSEMEDLRQLAIQTGQDTVFSATDAGNAITELAKGGLTEADIKAGALKTTMDLAASSGMDLGEAANVVVQAMGAFGLSANESAEAANALAGAAAASSTDVEPLTQALAQCSAGAKNAGWSIQETTAVLARFADAGIEGSDAGTSLKTMLQRLAAPTDSAATMIEQLGIQTRDSNGDLLGASEIAEELQNKLGGLDSASRDAALSTIFGSDAMRAATVMMDSGTEGIQKYINAANDQEAAQRLANSQMSDGSRAIEELKGSLETAAIQIGDTLAPIVQKVAELITALVNKFSALPEGVQQVIVVVGILVAALGPLLMVIGQISLGISAVAGALSKLSGIGGVATKLVGGIKTAVTGLLGMITAHPVIAVITAIIAALVTLYNKCEWFREGVNRILKAIRDGFFAAWDGIVEFFTETIPNAWNEMLSSLLANPTIRTIVTTITDSFTKLKENLNGIWNGIKQLAQNAWEFIKNATLAPVLLMIDLVTGDFEKLKSDLENILNNIKNAVANIWDSIKEITSNIWNEIKNVVSTLVSLVKETAISGFEALRDGIKNAIRELPKIVSDIFEKIGSTISGWIDNAWEWGADFINGLKEGILSGVRGIVNAVKGIGDKIRSFLHFSRPDEGPLRDYETWMPDFIDGMVKGINENVYKVSNAVKRVAKTMSESMYGGTPALASATQTNIVLNNNVGVQIGNQKLDSYIVETAKKGFTSQVHHTKRGKGRR
ncbi:phage tail tape measure protein [[Ruminococcus] gnavus]|uniref:phage tail tape measure protein n=1 Tax=Mediterraneibacter gnavus TaxID=33038 RepID=UPI002285E31D|nr:phage tail tape measure protein [Mediterraneibacter gnavus]MCZ0646781.1 phage tail tape measure protein [Mediterraneibacter gnavus]